ncbi:MAG TPA: LD-carboxypeptidase [Bacteroidales bacterium]|nr:LD-carboxypeptidase [Bacteroidales bacterium]
MIVPHFLKKGDKIAIVSPSGYSNVDFVNFSADYISELGYIPLIFPSCLNKHFQFGGTDQERLEDLQEAFDNEGIAAILCSRGGYGAIRIVDRIDFSKFIKNPKWLIGFSDITNFHLALNKLKICSIHGQMTKAIYEQKNSEAVKNIFDILAGRLPEYKIEGHKLNRGGEAKAELIGGNLSIIYSLQGTKFEIDTTGKILFIEDLNEYLYHLDRIMINLKMTGKLDNLKALIVGAFTDMKDNPNPFGKDAFEIINEHTAEYNYPVCYNFPIGHIDDNLPLICGKKYNLTVSEDVKLFPITD